MSQRYFNCSNALQVLAAHFFIAARITSRVVEFKYEKLIAASFVASLCSPLATIFVNAASTGADSEPSRLEQKQIQALVRDVVSVGIEHDFHNGKISNRDLILFGIYQIALRHPEQLQHGKAAGETQISAQAVASVARRFFGKNLVPQSVED